MLYGESLVSDVTKILLGVAAVFVLVPLGIAVAFAVLSDAGMLVSEFGVWGLAIFLAPTVAILVWSHFHGPSPPR